jgi:hypothetical protein
MSEQSCGFNMSEELVGQGVLSKKNKKYAI